MGDLQSPEPCFEERYRSMIEIEAIFGDVKESLARLAENLGLDFGADYPGLEPDHWDRYGGVPEGHRRQIIPLMDYAMDIVRRTGGDPIPVHGDLRSYVKYPDRNFDPFVHEIELLIRDIRAVAMGGHLNLDPQIKQMQSALKIARTEAARKCGNDVPISRQRAAPPPPLPANADAL